MDWKAKRNLGALPEIVQTIVNAIPVIIEGILDAVIGAVPLIVDAGLMETNLNGLKSTVSTVTKRVETVESDLGTVEENILDINTGVSELEQTTSSISATVSTKADKTGGSASSFGWSLTSSGFTLYASGSTVLSVTSSGATITGTIKATSGTIGGFTISSSAIYKTKTSYSSTTSGVYLGTDGIGLGAGTFYVTSGGALTAKSGNIGSWTINTSYLGTSQTGGSFYMASAGDSSAYWIRAHDAASGGGNRTFSVSKTGALYASSADITGKVTATSGSIKNLTIDGKLTFGGNSDYYINANYNDSGWYLRLPGMKSDEANGTVFSGKLSAPSGTIGGWTIGSASLYCTIENSDGTVKGTGIQAPSAGIWAIAVGYDSEDSWARAPFRVSHSGVLYATSATITGTFTNRSSSGLGLEISGSTLSFYNGTTKLGHITGGTGYTPWNNSGGTVNGIAVSTLLCADGGIRVGKALQISTGNGIYVSNKLALAMGQIKVQTNTSVTRYLLFYCGILVGISNSKYSGITDYSASTYAG